MGWARLDDGFHDHPKVGQASLAAVGLFCKTLSYCTRYETDGLVDGDYLRMKGQRRARHLIKELLDVGLLERVPVDDPRIEVESPIATKTLISFAVANDLYAIHDFLDFNPSRAEVSTARQRNAQRQGLFRDRDLANRIRRRDADQCRYCGEEVNWKDRRGQLGGTYDHVDPSGGNNASNVVVACRGCNSRKRGHSLDELGWTLLPPAGGQLDFGGAAA